MFKSYRLFFGASAPENTGVSFVPRNGIESTSVGKYSECELFSVILYDVPIFSTNRSLIILQNILIIL